MPDTTASINSKGTDGTGVSEDLALEMFNSIGKHWMAVVELQAVMPHGPNLKGKRKVDLVINLVEVATDDTLSDHLREIQRTIHQNRALHAEDRQLIIDTGDDLAPKVSDLIAAGAVHVVHDFVLDESDPDGACDVCAKPEDDALHPIHDELPDPDVDEPEEEEGEEPEDEHDETSEQDDALEAAEETARQLRETDPWEDEPATKQTRPLSSVPDPFTTQTGTD